jgi:putative lipoic acid-binding regulatory protein
MEADKKLEELLDFPAVFTFRVMAHASPALRALCQDTVERTLGHPAQQVTEHPSASGKFSSIRVTTVVVSADEIRAAYAALKDTVPNLKMLL